MSTPRCTVFLVTRADAPARLRLGLWALTAASVGERVEILLTGEALALWARGGWDGGADERGQGEAGSGLPAPGALLAEARGLGPVRVVSCATELHLAGVTEDEARRCLDDVVSLPTFWRETQGARMVTL